MMEVIRSLGTNAARLDRVELAVKCLNKIKAIDSPKAVLEKIGEITRCLEHAKCAATPDEQLDQAVASISSLTLEHLWDDD